MAHGFRFQIGLPFQNTIGTPSLKALRSKDMDGTRLPEQQTQFGERRGSGLESKSKRPLHNTAMLIQQDSGRLLTIKQVAELLQVPQSWVYGRTRARDRYR